MLAGLTVFLLLSASAATRADAPLGAGRRRRSRGAFPVRAVIRAVALAALLATALAPAREARAHEVLHEVDRGRALAVRTYYADGETLADAAYEVFSPADPRIPHQKGRTDRAGWLAFVPDAAGTWRVKVVDASGHGLDVTIEVTASGATGSGARPSGGGAWFVLRPLLGVALVAAIFAALFVLSRRRRGSP